MQLEACYKTSFIGINRHSFTTDEWMLRFVCESESSKVCSAAQGAYMLAGEFGTNLNQMKSLKALVPNKQDESSRLQNRKGSNKLRSGGARSYCMCNIFFKVKMLMLANQCLRCSGLKTEAEGLILAVQDRSLFTGNYQADILKKKTLAQVPQHI